MRDGARPASAATATSGEAVIARRIRLAASRTRWRDREAVRAFLRPHPERAQSGHERRDSVAFVPELTRAGNFHCAAERAERGQRRQLVDQQRHLRGIDRDRFEPLVRDGQASHGLARFFPSILCVPTAAARRSTSSQAVRVGLSPTSSNAIREPGDRPRDREKGS